MRKITAVTFLILCVSAAAASPVFAKAQDIIKMNHDIVIERNMVVGDVVAIGGDVTIAGTVEKNVVAVGGSVTLKPGAKVDGQVVVVGGEIIKDSSSVIGERITHIYMPHFIPSITTAFKGSWAALWVTLSVLVFLGFLGLALLLVALIPEHIGNAIAALEGSFVKMLFWGILWSILIVPIAVILAISIVGIALIPLEILLVVLAMIIGYIVSAVFVGKHVLAAFTKNPIPFVDAIIGILILFLIGFVPVVGPLVKLLLLTAGFGAVLTTRFGTLR